MRVSAVESGSRNFPPHCPCILTSETDAVGDAEMRFEIPISGSSSLTDSSKAVFLSYASQDAEAAGRIAAALRAAGIEVWFDRSELRGGEAWDASIRRQIKGCRLFVPIVSAHTDARPEGYFRLEWKLAVDRSHLMADDEPFLLPVVVDGTPDATARVPDTFRRVQWTQLPDGEGSAAFIGRVQRLMSPDAPAVSAAPTRIVTPASTATEPKRRPAVAPRPAAHRRMKWLKFAVPVLAVVLLALIFVPSWLKKEHARNVLLPKIQELTGKMVRSNGPLLDMAQEVERYLPNDPTLAKLWPAIAMPLSIKTEPAGAEVFWKDYGMSDSEWRSAGITPLKGVKVARNHLRVEIRKKGYQTIEMTHRARYHAWICSARSRTTWCAYRRSRPPCRSSDWRDMAARRCLSSLSTSLR